MIADLADCSSIITYCNKMIEASLSAEWKAKRTGEVLAFIKNAVADTIWVTELVDVYESTDAIAVDRRMTRQ
jgi:high-affinity Fe2+/Pb2+ permease